jgi:hypothetical protein
MKPGSKNSFEHNYINESIVMIIPDYYKPFTIWKQTAKFHLTLATNL